MGARGTIAGTIAGTGPSQGQSIFGRAVASNRPGRAPKNLCHCTVPVSRWRMAQPHRSARQSTEARETGRLSLAAIRLVCAELGTELLSTRFRRIPGTELLSIACIAELAMLAARWGPDGCFQRFGLNDRHTHSR